MGVSMTRWISLIVLVSCGQKETDTGGDSTLSQEHILVMAHYDHLGVTDEGEVYNRAFDNATGVAAALELARVRH